MHAARSPKGGALPTELARGLLAVVLVAVVACGGGGEAPPVSPTVLHLALPAAWPHDAWLPAFAEPFAEAPEVFAARSGVGVVEDPWRESDLSTAAVAALEAETPPDRLVVEGASLPALVMRDRLVPLDGSAADHPDLLADLPDAVLERFRVDGPLFAVPLGADRGHADLGFAVSTHAAAAGREAPAPRPQARSRLPSRAPATERRPTPAVHAGRPPRPAGLPPSWPAARPRWGACPSCRPRPCPRAARRAGAPLGAGGGEVVDPTGSPPPRAFASNPSDARGHPVVVKRGPRVGDASRRTATSACPVARFVHHAGRGEPRCQEARSRGRDPEIGPGSRPLRPCGCSAVSRGLPPLAPSGPSGARRRPCRRFGRTGARAA